jgi:hypothetical protein
LPILKLSEIVPEKSDGSWDTEPIFLLRDFRSSSLMFWPSINMSPALLDHITYSSKIWVYYFSAKSCNRLSALKNNSPSFYYASILPCFRYIRLFRGFSALRIYEKIKH